MSRTNAILLLVASWIVASSLGACASAPPQEPVAEPVVADPGPPPSEVAPTSAEPVPQGDPSTQTPTEPAGPAAGGCTSDRDCAAGQQCDGPEGCDATWTCQPQRPCTRDLAQFCGCDGQTFGA